MRSLEPPKVTNLETTVQVHCLGCAAVYVKPGGGGTISANPGCPLCGYLGWATEAQISAARRRGRFGGGHPRSRSVRPR